MAKKISGFITTPLFVFTVLVIGVLSFAPGRIFNHSERRAVRPSEQTRIVIPQNLLQGDADNEEYLAEKLTYENARNAKAALGERETILSVLNQDFDGDLQDEQIIAYRNLSEQGSPIYITYIQYDDLSGGYKRIWSAPTIITQPGTVSLYTQDLLGDRSVSVIITGINADGEHTLTALRKNESLPEEGGAENESGPFTKIAEIHIDGSIAVQEVERTRAYQQGLAKGQSFAIAAYGKDADSANMLDQIEITYIYNPVTAFYEQSRITRMPGTQIEQRQVRRLLDGNPEVFERFIDGLWYYTGADGTLDNWQYIYFNLPNRELIFYGDESQQVFTWLNSSSTRYGVYVSSQNISVTTLRRSLSIELESMDSIRIRVSEDVRLNVGAADSWDGSYRKAGTILTARRSEDALSVEPYRDASFDGSIGSLVFNKDGFYELYTQGTVRTGNYAFFALDDSEFLELRPGGITGLSRETYLVSWQTPESLAGSRKILTLIRVRLGTDGIQEAHEAAITLAPAAGGVDES
ncbi:MAG: pallilysin-related adhesin [Spirochaetaceae bacterium]|jgi:hypothetical protein|nr:pallilysin-related adhesin [Spirochaetaceae bacterium]